MSPLGNLTFLILLIYFFFNQNLIFLQKYSLHTRAIVLVVCKSDFGFQNSLPASEIKNAGGKPMKT